MIIWRNKYYLHNLFDIQSLRCKAMLYDLHFTKKPKKYIGIKRCDNVKMFNCNRKDYG